MKKVFVSSLFLLTFSMIFVMATNPPPGWDPEAVDKAKKAKAEFLEKDPSLEKYFNEAYGYAVFPSVGKGAIGIGGAHGFGTLFQGGEAVGETELIQVTIGFALGGQSYSEIIFFENEAILEVFKTGGFEVAAQASAIAITASASADLDYNNGVAIITMGKGGLMYEASVGGQKFNYEPFGE